jgi:hypothetical protein
MEGYQGAGYGMEHNKRRRIKIRRAQKFKGLTDSDPEHYTGFVRSSKCIQ